MNKDNWEEWLENPVTKYLIKYLKDSAKEAADFLSDDILHGAIASELEQAKTSSMCMTLIQISEIDREEIENFYEEQKERKEIR